MSSRNYPENIYYHDQKIDSRISLKPEFKAERKVMRALPAEHAENHYVSEELQENYIVNLTDDDVESYFVDSSGEFLDGEYNFVLTCEEEPKLLCDPNLHHSSLANGKKVLAVGTLVFENGVLTIVTNNSGHYRPTDEEMLAFIKALYKASGGSLHSYKSYCSDTPVTYPVSELIETNNFSSMEPLKENELIDARTKKRKSILSDYDERDKENSCPERRFGKILKKEQNDRYERFLASNTAFFNAGTKDITSEEKPVRILN